MCATGQTDRSAAVSGLGHLRPWGIDGALGSYASSTEAQAGVSAPVASINPRQSGRAARVRADLT